MTTFYTPTPVQYPPYSLVFSTCTQLGIFKRLLQTLSGSDLRRDEIPSHEFLEQKQKRPGGEV